MTDVTAAPCTLWLKGRVFRDVCLGYLYSHFIYNPNSKTENINYMVDTFSQTESDPTLAPARLQKVEKLAGFSHIVGPAHQPEPCSE